jgi:hypothetical protein
MAKTIKPGWVYIHFSKPLTPHALDNTLGPFVSITMTSNGEVWAKSPGSNRGCGRKVAEIADHGANVITYLWMVGDGTAIRYLQMTIDTECP